MAEDPEPEVAEPPADEPKKGSVRVPSLLHNYISLSGLSITFACIASIILLFLIEFSGSEDRPYLGLLTYILLPAGLFFGIGVIILGMLIERWRRRKLTPEEVAAYPILDLSGPRRRRKFLAFVFLSFFFFFVTAFASYRAYEYTESVEFCGLRCHTVMKPEYVAFNASPHARLHCVDCHVGGGAEWYVRSKLNGVRQLYGVMTDDFSRPVQTPVHNMRPANDTCAKCHWPEKFHGEVIRVFNRYGYDEANSLRQTRLLVSVGGGATEGGPVGGIHWHMNLANEITYAAADEKRQNIPWVRMKDANGNVTEYVSKNLAFSPEQIRQMPTRRMDCIDCHNRPAHIFLSPNNAVDQSLADGKLDPSLPFMKARAVEALAAPYATEDEAVEAIGSKLDEYYRSTYPEVYSQKRNLLAANIAEVQRIYRTYFFPEMKTNWSTHVNNIGHLNFQGCFRCHDGQHVSKDGRVIRNECNICHTTLDQTIGGQTFKPADGKFQHPVNLGDRGNWLCASCHKGDRAFSHPLNLGDISRFECAECHSGIYEKVPY